MCEEERNLKYRILTNPIPLKEKREKREMVREKLRRNMEGSQIDANPNLELIHMYSGGAAIPYKTKTVPLSTRGPIVNGRGLFG